MKFINSFVKRFKLYLTFIFASLIIILVIAIYYNLQVMHLYQNSLNSILEEYSIFLEVESINNSISNGYVKKEFPDITTIQLKIDYLQEKMPTNDELIKIGVREKIDFYNILESYLKGVKKVVNDIYLNGDKLNEGIDYSQSFNQAQLLYDFLQKSNFNVYSNNMDKVQIINDDINTINKKINFLYLVLFVLILIFIFIMFSDLRKTTAIINILTAYAEKLKNHPTLREKVNIEKADNEFAIYSNAFNEMVETIQNQIDEIKEMSEVREQLKNAEISRLSISNELQNNKLRLLQSTINPHFLFNTLNMIKSSAYLEGADNTSELIEATANLLNNNLRTSHSLPLSEEISNLKNYIFIQEKRFGPRIRFDFEIDLFYSKFIVPNMTLQPLVENAIKYGLNERMVGGIVITQIKRVSNGLLICVCDNGVGISEKKRYEVLEHCYNSNDSNRIGLRNTYQRLKLFYMKDIEVVIDKEQEKNRFGFIIPIKEDELCIH